MTKSKIAFIALADSVGTAVYTGLVAALMQHGDRYFGNSSFWGPIALLLLFVLSALVTASLVLGQPIYLFLEGKKKESVTLFISTVGFLTLIVVCIFAGLALMRVAD